MSYRLEQLEAHTNLNTFAAVIALLEGGLLYGRGDNSAKRCADKIIKLCKAEQQKQLLILDKP